MHSGSGMSTPFETAKVKLVTIVAGAELLDGLEEHLQSLGTSGYTVIHGGGRGRSGSRERGWLLTGNVRVETLVRPADARKLMEHLAREYAGRPLVAFSHDVDAIPREHFV
jgi:hypothetical protein